MKPSLLSNQALSTLAANVAAHLSQYVGAGATGGIVITRGGSGHFGMRLWTPGMESPERVITPSAEIVSAATEVLKVTFDQDDDWIELDLRVDGSETEFGEMIFTVDYKHPPAH